MVLNSLWEVFVWVVMWAGTNAPYAKGCDVPYYLWPAMDEVLFRLDCLKRGDKYTLKDNFDGNFKTVADCHPWSLFTRWVQDAGKVPPSGMVNCLPPAEYVEDCMKFMVELERGVTSRLCEVPPDGFDQKHLDSVRNRIWELQRGYRAMGNAHAAELLMERRYHLRLADNCLQPGGLRHLPPPAPLELLNEPPPGYRPPKE